jgi:hypothetical protein
MYAREDVPGKRRDPFQKKNEEMILLVAAKKQIEPSSQTKKHARERMEQTERGKERSYQKLTSTPTVVAKRRKREVDALFHGVQRDRRAGALIHQCSSPRGAPISWHVVPLAMLLQ